MNRRGFLESLAVFSAAIAIDPEILIWKPEAKTIFIPAANQFITARMITYKLLVQFQKELQVAQTFNWEYQEEFRGPAEDVHFIHKPQRYLASA